MLDFLVYAVCCFFFLSCVVDLLLGITDIGPFGQWKNKVLWLSVILRVFQRLKDVP